MLNEKPIRVSPEEMAAQRQFARDFSILPDRPRTYHIVTYGCQMNAHDSEKLAGMLEDMGLTAAPSREEADFVLHNTCCIRDNAERKALGNVTWLKEIKKQRPDMLIGVCGCTGIFNVVTVILQHRWSRQDQKDERLDAIEQTLDALKEAQRSSMEERIRSLVNKYHQRGEITIAELANLKDMHKRYVGVGGNGNLDTEMDVLDLIPVKGGSTT